MNKICCLIVFILFGTYCFAQNEYLEVAIKQDEQLQVLVISLFNKSDNKIYISNKNVLNSNATSLHFLTYQNNQPLTSQYDEIRQDGKGWQRLIQLLPHTKIACTYKLTSLLEGIPIQKRNVINRIKVEVVVDYGIEYEYHIEAKYVCISKDFPLNMKP